eukprot:TRINITY_DN2706_c2_g2_i2.p1 TRINITY_DN2706_c2_g2~~TRINITY_DN2706_c2_g2_i2.p1  ORF type:complete len:248 (+),score=21.55 TRINITY_DN2706_c2_g2_i2:36-746(+)
MNPVSFTNSFIFVVAELSNFLTGLTSYYTNSQLSKIQVSPIGYEYLYYRSTFKMKRTKTKYGPDATLSSLLDEWFTIKKFKGRNGMTDHWVCTRCPGDDPVHQSICTSQGTRKRAHILGGQFAAIHRIRVCQGIDKEERKQLIRLYNQCSRNSKKFKFSEYSDQGDSDDEDDDDDDSDSDKKIQKRKKEIQQNGEVNDRFEKKYDEFNVKRKKRKDRKSPRLNSSHEIPSRMPSSA